MPAVPCSRKRGRQLPCARGILRIQADSRSRAGSEGNGVASCNISYQFDTEGKNGRGRGPAPAVPCGRHADYTAQCAAGERGATDSGLGSRHAAAASQRQNGNGGSGRE